ncbi:MAG: GPP34 family phosphoprotein [Clostridia bacterium]|nr:GPP34 family phosphoprotein [Clostridia bacterium]
MKDLSIMQEYFLCAVNDKGKISSFSTEKLVCMVASGLLEMQLENCVEIADNRVRVTGALPAQREYLRSLYAYVDQPKPVKVEKILDAYNNSASGRRLFELMDAVGASLEAAGLAEAGRAGLLGGRRAYVPKREAINGVIDQIRAELLEAGEVTEDVAALVVLLDRSKSLKQYFSDFERKELKARLKQIMNAPTGKMIRDMVEYVEGMLTATAVTLLLFH